MTEAGKPETLPDLDDLMDAGLTLRQGLSFWSALANIPGGRRGNWRDELEFWRKGLAPQKDN